MNLATGFHTQACKHWSRTKSRYRGFQFRFDKTTTFTSDGDVVVLSIALMASTTMIGCVTMCRWGKTEGVLDSDSINSKAKVEPVVSCAVWNCILLNIKKCCSIFACHEKSNLSVLCIMGKLFTALANIIHNWSPNQLHTWASYLEKRVIHSETSYSMCRYPNWTRWRILISSLSQAPTPSQYGSDHYGEVGEPCLLIFQASLRLCLEM